MDHNTTTPRIIGVDLSLTGTGIAGPGWTEIISTPTTEPDDYYARWRRLKTITEQVHEYTTGADLIVIEGPSLKSEGRGTFDRAGLWWHVTGPLLAAHQPLAVVPPSSRAQYGCGRGNGSKTMVIEQVTRRLGHVWTDLRGSDDAADAAVLCAMGHDRLGTPLAQLPDTHRKALTKVNWPHVPGWAIEPGAAA